MTPYQIVKRIGARPNSKCGLDKNKYGEYTLGCYEDMAYWQIRRKTSDEIRAVAKRLKFDTVLDRIYN